jgi:hypothetical protein
MINKRISDMISCRRQCLDSKTVTIDKETSALNESGREKLSDTEVKRTCSLIPELSYCFLFICTLVYYRKEE